jgi:uncharacterized SAM-binding protein YcdF (DUF218 family)
MTRNHFSELPQVREINEILQKESVRTVINSKKHKHYVDYSPFLNWLDEIGITGFRQADSLEKLFEWADEDLIQDVIKRTIALDSGNSVLKRLTEYMCFADSNFEESEDEADLVMVFGSKSLARIEKGVELFKQGVGNFILISGSGPNYEAENLQLPEAINFYNHAVSEGVSKDKILVEPGSISIADNVKTSLNLMDNLGIVYKSIAIVAAWFALRRAYAHLMKLGPRDLAIFCYYPEVQSENLSPDGWYRSKVGVKVVFGQWLKTKGAMLLNNSI